MARPGELEPPAHSAEVDGFFNDIAGVFHNLAGNWPIGTDRRAAFSKTLRVRSPGRDRLVSEEINPFPETTMFTASGLHVFAARSNPLHYRTPHQNRERFAEHMLDAGVTLTVIECAFGDEEHVRDLDGVRHIPVRAKTRLWTKENGGPVATEPKVRFRLGRAERRDP